MKASSLERASARPVIAPREGLDPRCELLPGDWIALVLGERGDARRGRELVARLGLRGLAGRTTVELVREAGLRPAQAERLVAAFALARTLALEERGTRPLLASAESVHRHVWPDLRDREQECFVGLYLDGKHRLRREERLSVGTLTASLVHPREVFRPAIRCAAAALIVAHNHPSGDPEPSAEDLEVTRRLRETGRLLGIPLLDHVISAARGFVSLRERLGF